MPLKNNYTDIDANAPTPYVLPPIPCGWYEHTNEFGEKTVYQFRRMPKAAKYTGKYGLWLKDKDAGMVLIGVVTNNKLQQEGAVYSRQFDTFMGTHSPIKPVLTKRACSWCGRELLDNTRLCHDSPKCRPAT